MFVVIGIVLVLVLALIIVRVQRRRNKGPRLSVESKYILARYNKLPAEFRTVDIVPTLRAYDTNEGGVDHVNDHFYISRGYAGTRCKPNKHNCTYRYTNPFRQHERITIKVKSLETQVADREKAMRDAANRSGMDNAKHVLDRLDEEIRISGQVTDELNNQ